MASLSELLYEVRRIAESRQILTEEKIQSIYRSLMDELYSYIGKNYTKYADADGRLYLSYLDAQNKRATFLREIIKNVDEISPDIKKEITSLINDTYKESYTGMVEAVKSAKTSKKFAELVKDIEVNPDVLNQAMKNNISKLTLNPVLEKHRNEIIYQIQQTLNIGLMQGDRYETMAKRISERVGVSYSKAMNITRTESHRNVESGFMDCAEELQSKMKGDSNLIYAVTWRTMKDERVRPNQRRKTKHGWKIVKGKGSANHQQMEGVTIKVGELFDLGNGIKTKAPGQSGDAANDCRCRCFLEYNLMTVEEFAKATNKTVDEVRKKLNIDVAENNRQELIENIRGKQIWDGISESDRDIIVNYLRSSDENALTLINNTIDKVSVDWRQEYGTAHYKWGSGNITMYKDDTGDKLGQVFWHEYGHYLDDATTSGTGIKYVETFTSKRTGKVDTVVIDGTSSKAEKIGWQEAATKDVNKLLDSVGLGDKYYAQASGEYEYGGCWLHRKADDSLIDLDSSYDDMNILSQAIEKRIDDISGITKAKNYLKDMGYPDEPAWSDYHETYVTPKRGITRTREKYKGADNDYHNAIDEVRAIKEKFEAEHDMTALKKEQNRLWEEAQKVKHSMAWACDTFDGSCNGAFLCEISLGGHSKDYYRVNRNGIKESVANVFMANATGDKDTMKAMKEICPETYKVLTEAWKVGG